MQDEVLVAEPDSSAQHSHPCLDVSSAIPNALHIPNKHLEVSQWQKLQYKIEILVSGGKDALQRNDIGMLKFLEMLEFPNGIRSHAFFILLLNFDLLDGNQGLGIIPKVTKIDIGIGTFTELLPCFLLK